jgi:hypothetical protein
MHPTGALHDPIDDRDWKISKCLARSAGAPLPNYIDYSSVVPIVRDQESLGSCVGFAATEVKTAQEAADLGQNYWFSPLFIYWLRENSGEGMYLRDAMKILSEYGVCEEYLLAYKKNMASRGTPDKRHFSNAANFKIAAYARISTVDEMRRTLVENGPFIIAVPVYESFHNVGRDGKIPLPNTATEVLSGGHALCVVGYDDQHELFKIKNSWGETWGAKGFGFLPYEFVEKYLWDAWSSVDAKSVKKNIVTAAINFFMRTWYTIVANWPWFVIVAMALGMIIYAFISGEITQ